MDIRDIRLPKSLVVIKKTIKNSPGLSASERYSVSLADWINYAIEEGIIDVHITSEMLQRELIDYMEQHLEQLT